MKANHFREKHQSTLYRENFTSIDAKIVNDLSIFPLVISYQQKRKYQFVHYGKKTFSSLFIRKFNLLYELNDKKSSNIVYKLLVHYYKLFL
jgi:hypothetical protein